MKKVKLTVEFENDYKIDIIANNEIFEFSKKQLYLTRQIIKRLLQEAFVKEVDLSTLRNVKFIEE